MTTQKTEATFYYNPLSFETTKTLLNSAEPCYKKVSKIFFTMVFDITFMNPALLVLENLVLGNSAAKNKEFLNALLTLAFRILGFVYLFYIPTIASILLHTIFFKEKIAFQITLAMLCAINGIIFLYIVHPYVKTSILNSKETPLSNYFLEKILPPEIIWNPLQQIIPPNFLQARTLGDIVKNICSISVILFIKNPTNLIFCNIINTILYKNKTSFSEKTFSLFIIFFAIYFYTSIIPMISLKILTALSIIWVLGTLGNIANTIKELNEAPSCKTEKIKDIITKVHHTTQPRLFKLVMANDEIPKILDTPEEEFEEKQPHDFIIKNLPWSGQKYPEEGSERDFIEELLLRLTHHKWCLDNNCSTPPMYWLLNEDENVSKDHLCRKIKNSLLPAFHPDHLTHNLEVQEKIKKSLNISDSATTKRDFEEITKIYILLMEFISES